MTFILRSVGALASSHITALAVSLKDNFFSFQAVKLEACSLITELCDAKCNEGLPVSQLKQIWHYVNFLQTPEVGLYLLYFT